MAREVGSPQQSIRTTTDIPVCIAGTLNREAYAPLARGNACLRIAGSGMSFSPRLRSSVTRFIVSSNNQDGYHGGIQGADGKR